MCCNSNNFSPKICCTYDSRFPFGHYCWLCAYAKITIGRYYGDALPERYRLSLRSFINTSFVMALMYYNALCVRASPSAQFINSVLPISIIVCILLYYSLVHVALMVAVVLTTVILQLDSVFIGLHILFSIRYECIRNFTFINIVWSFGFDFKVLVLMLLLS